MIDERSCGFILIDDQKRFLLLKHANGGHYDFCKGHINENENNLQCALREAREELNVSVEVIEGFEEKISYKMPNSKIKEVIFFLGIFKGEIKLQDTEITQIQLLEYHQAYELITFDTNKNILKKAKEFLD